MLKWLRPRRRCRGERGAVAVEAALVTPVVLLMVFGMIEFSFALRDHVAVVVGGAHRGSDGLHGRRCRRVHPEPG